MATIRKFDRKNKRTILMYVENGLQHRLNTVPRDGLIPMHVHRNNEHWTHILNGIFDLIMIPPDSDAEIVKEVRKGEKVLVEKGWQHTFIPKDVPIGWLKRWSADCVYPEGLIL